MFLFYSRHKHEKTFQEFLGGIKWKHRPKICKVYQLLLITIITIIPVIAYNLFTYNTKLIQITLMLFLLALNKVLNKGFFSTFSEIYDGVNDF